MQYGRAKSGGNPALHCLAPLQSLLARLTGVALAPPELSEAAVPPVDMPTAGSRPPFRPASKHAFNPQKQKVPYAPGAENRQKLTARMALSVWCHTKFRNLTNHIEARCWHSFYLALQLAVDREVKQGPISQAALLIEEEAELPSLHDSSPLGGHAQLACKS